MPDVLDPGRTALVIIDLQSGIVAGSTVPYPAREVVEHAGRLLGAARRAGILPVLVHVGGAPDHVDRLRQAADQPQLAGPVPADWSTFVQKITPKDGEVVIFKRQWGAFYGTDLDLQLRRRGIDTLVLCGISTEFGVESTARDAYERNYRQFFAEDAMSGRSEAAHRAAIEHVFPRIGHVRRTDDLLELMAVPSAG